MNANQMYGHKYYKLDLFQLLFILSKFIIEAEKHIKRALMNDKWDEWDNDKICMEMHIF